jgi:hypothetical protein
MGEDVAELIGKWTVRVKNWVWEYEFSPGGKVTWQDTRSNERGEGRWALSSTLLNLSWSDSATKESWRRPLNPEDHTGWYNSEYYAGPYKVQKKVVAAPNGATDVDPSVAKLPFGLYVDAFVDYKYDVNYQVPQNKSWAFSSLLRVRYYDDAIIEFDIEKDFSTAPMSSDDARDSIAHAKLGRGGRIVPDVLNQATAPQLWQARVDALQAQDDEANVIMGMIVTATAFTVTLPAMGAGPAPGSPARPGLRRSIPPTKVPPAPIQGGIVRLGPGNAPGSLWASIQKTAAGVVYRVDMIVLQGKGPGVATARATHRQMIREAAIAAKSQGQSTFKMVGKQANPNFVRHADQLAKEVGVAGSGKAGSAGAGYPDYEVILDVAKTLAQ